MKALCSVIMFAASGTYVHQPFTALYDFLELSETLQFAHMCVWVLCFLGINTGYIPKHH